jgi:hypothetical protein
MDSTAIRSAGEFVSNSPQVRHHRTSAENRRVAAFQKAHSLILNLTEENLHSPEVHLDIQNLKSISPAK